MKVVKRQNHSQENYKFQNLLTDTFCKTVITSVFITTMTSSPYKLQVFRDGPSGPRAKDHGCDLRFC